MAVMIDAMNALNALMTMDEPVTVADDSVLAPPVEPVVKRVIRTKKTVEPIVEAPKVVEPVVKRVIRTKKTVEPVVEAPKVVEPVVEAPKKSKVKNQNYVEAMAIAEDYIARCGGVLPFVERYQKLVALEAKVNIEKDKKKIRAKNRAEKRKNGEPVGREKKTALGEEDMRRIAREEALKLNTPDSDSDSDSD